MAHAWFREAGEEIVGIGVEAVSEESLSSAGEVLVSTGAAIVNTERVKRFLVQVLLLIPKPLRDRIPEAARWKTAFLKTTLKRYARRAMRRRHVSEDIVFMVVDTIDDLVEAFKRHTEAELTDESLTRYINSSAEHAVANPSPSTTRAAAAAHGVSMTPTFKLPGDVLSPLIAAEIAVLDANGIKRWGRLWFIKHESFYGDPEHELHGSATIEEAVRALLVARPKAVRVLNRTDLAENKTDVRQDEAIRAFLGMAEIYLVDASFAARGHDEADRLMGGGVRRAIKENAVAAGGIIKTGGIRAIKAMAWSAVAGLVVVILGLSISAWGIFAIYDTKGAHDISLAHIGVGTIVSLVGMGFFGVSVFIWETGKAGILWAYGTVGAPIGYFKAVVKAVAQTFGINIEQESA